MEVLGKWKFDFHLCNISRENLLATYILTSVFVNKLGVRKICVTARVVSEKTSYRILWVYYSLEAYTFFCGRETSKLTYSFQCLKSPY